MEKVRIEIPKADIKEIVYIPKGDLGDFKKAIDGRFEKLDNLILAIVASVVVSVIGAVIAVVGIFLDQMRFNNAAYREYSDKINTQDTLVSDLSKLKIESDQQLRIIESQQKIITGLRETP